MSLTTTVTGVSMSNTVTGRAKLTENELVAALNNSNVPDLRMIGASSPSTPAKALIAFVDRTREWPSYNAVRTAALKNLENRTLNEEDSVSALKNENVAELRMIGARSASTPARELIGFVNRTREWNSYTAVRAAALKNLESRKLSEQDSIAALKNDDVMELRMVGANSASTPASELIGFVNRTREWNSYADVRKAALKNLGNRTLSEQDSISVLNNDDVPELRMIGAGSASTTAKALIAFVERTREWNSYTDVRKTAIKNLESRTLSEQDSISALKNENVAELRMVGARSATTPSKELIEFVDRTREWGSYAAVRAAAIDNLRSRGSN